MSLKKYFNKPLTVALATVATATLAPVASAATFNFSYTSSLGTITATVDGTLQPDNNTVFVSSISNTTFNGSAAPALPFVGSFAGVISSGSVTGQAVLSLDGSGLDFTACDTTLCDNNGFGFRPAGFGSPVELFASGAGYGSVSEPFVITNYSLTPAGTTTVPEPATVLGLLSVAGVGLLCKGRKLEK
ncbi:MULTISPECIES: PEP-CTERM sorting domain-containing protein [unclassified Microcystis]|uniref:PEP-CTERM sorting domain-containing protein n=1 Tax=Microcystis flos-aquae Mf_QC_C_20070823_S10D TaxID=2486236 RepID=A0A552L748_9CHRO|nr:MULTISPECIES: PEP-CTERM sorting domain-containing protein [unclassified Microcystis]MCA2818409.1 PEP-CTERM sorting domain-containing protein [Microcystis sp. M085S1]MCA2856723.1 PEP-CTERM sorting domain-containing protein [Microcystis sp. M065S1]TRT78987.1 MAG: PEP-CTERM sorting domain-containing protein [Microcystis flos-aquae Ma_QC_C_20070823_S18]TRT97459.1 MAG: PEP-CTERM sorting domain-containing protein [Microcystis flos-aquae Ma_QC_C_20070823_S18D]TRV16056.1 MAG: PEP-CTERM sorting doma